MTRATEDLRIEPDGRFAEPRCLREDRGAVIPEFALVAPIIVVFMLIVFEFGFAYRQTIDLESAVRAAARQTTNLGDQRGADYLALQSFWSSMAKTKRVTIDRLVIYRTTALNGDPTNSACLTTNATPSGQGLSGHCNIFGLTQLQTMVPANFDNLTGTTCSASSWDRFWCPTSRKANQSDPPDYVGVYARVNYSPVTRLYWSSSVAFNDRAVMRIEPKVSQP
ncbi:MAG: pilus assembly protein [Acidimicrobiales bacterium]|nr:pilus assembly protein [Acidimicrobiales bacterium]